MRIVFFNRSYYPDFGATGQLLTELCEELVSRYGARVTVVAGVPLTTDVPLAVTPRWWLPVRRDERNGVRILRAFGTSFRPRRFVGRFSNYISYFVSAALASVRIGRADVVVAMTDPPIIGLVAGVAARLSGARMVFLCEDVFPEVARLLDDFQSPRIEALLSHVSRHVVRRADRVVALGDTMKRRLVETKGADPAKIAVIHNWADTEAIVPVTKDNAFSRANGLADGFVLMHSGNVGLSQNVGILLDVADRLRDLPDFVVAIVGDGASKGALVADAARRGLDNVKFFPYQPKEELSNLFSSADAFLVSLKEGLAGFIVPSKLYGILAAGRPFVVSADADCEAAQIARERDCGLVVPPGDCEGICAAVRCLYENRDRRQAMGANARRAGELFDRRRAVSSYAQLFTDLCARPARSGLKVGRAAPLKRAFDVALSGFGLVASSPLWLLFAALIKLEDGGAVFYRQPRVGKGGRLFDVLKFRSMIPDAEAVVGELQAGEHDPRVTRIGRIMRATAMDELPQLWNIFRGDMSFVGPRALRPGEIEARAGGRVRLDEVPGYEVRQQVVPGLTGIAQIYAARDVPARTKFRFDRVYVRRQSLLLDVKLVALSFWISARGKWEDRGRKF